MAYNQQPRNYVTHKCHIFYTHLQYVYITVLRIAVSAVSSEM